MANRVRVTTKIVKDFDGLALDRLKQKISAGKHAVLVGVEGAEMATIATVHEFGSPSQGIPERPFLRTAIHENAKKYVALNRKNLAQVLHGKMSIEQALGQLGEIAKGDVQAHIKNGEFKPLSPKTIAARLRSRSDAYNKTLQRKVTKKQKDGSATGPIDRPLIDSGQLFQSIKWKFE